MVIVFNLFRKKLKYDVIALDMDGIDNLPEETINYHHFQKILEKLCKLKKSCNYKQNINRIYNEKLHHNCLQKFHTLRLKT